MFPEAGVALDLPRRCFDSVAGWTTTRQAPLA
jgi:hypothetical protein